MPAARPFLRIALLLTLVCAVLVFAVDGLASLMPSSGVIYFSRVSADDNLYMLDPLHRVRYKLSAGTNLYTNRSTSPDGQQLAFKLYDLTDNLLEIRVFDFAALQSQPIYSTPMRFPDMNEADVYSWSPTGRYVSFAIDGRLLQYDFGTGEVRPMLRESREDYFNDSFPVWSSDETQIAFVSSLRETSTWQGYLANADGSNLQRVTRVDVCQFYAPRWSPVANLLAFSANCENTPTIFILNTDTGQLRALSDLDVPIWEPHWSPDGSRLLYIAGTQNRAVYTIAVDGTGIAYVAEGNFAFWSPDGERIVFSSSEGDLYTIGADGNDLQRLTFGEEKLIASGWSR